MQPVCVILLHPINHCVRAAPDSGKSTFLRATSGGIRQGGVKLAREVRELAHARPALTHISLVGASLGGLFCRYAAGLLFGAVDDDVFENDTTPEVDAH